eukprot:Platyproteum_vivax@DN14702_c0_g1_i1.p1
MPFNYKGGPQKSKSYDRPTKTHLSRSVAVSNALGNVANVTAVGQVEKNAECTARHHDHSKLCWCVKDVAYSSDGYYNPTNAEENSTILRNFHIKLKLSKTAETLWRVVYQGEISKYRDSKDFHRDITTGQRVFHVVKGGGLFIGWEPVFNIDFSNKNRPPAKQPPVAKLTGNQITALFNEIQTYKLWPRALHITDNKLVEQQGEVVDTTGVEALANLLSLPVSSLTDEDDDDKDPQLWTCHNTLSYLFVGWAGLAELGTSIVAPAVGANQWLRTLVLYRNDLNDKSCEYLAEALQANTFLQRLNLKGNNIGSLGAQHLANALADRPANSVALRTLEIAHNLIMDEGCKALCQALKSNETIQRLGLGAMWAAQTSLMCCKLMSLFEPLP